MLSNRQKLLAMLWCVAVASLLAAAAAHCGELRTDAGFALVGAGLDFATTQHALTRPLAFERHPWGQTTGQRIALKATGVSLVMAGEVALRRRGAHRKATALRWIYLGVNVAASAITLRQGRR